MQSQQPISPYNIQINSKPGRSSLPFIPNSTDILEAYAREHNIAPAALSFSRLFSSSRVLAGPTPQTRVLGIFRAVREQPANAANSTFYTFIGVYLLNMESPTLEYKPLIQRIETVQKRIRDFAIHPNGRQLMLVCQKEVEKFALLQNKQQKGLSWEASKISVVSLEQQVSIVDVSYHPSGEYAVGIAYMAKPTKIELRPVKIYSDSLKVQYSEDIEGRCMDSSPQYFQYLKKWSLVVHRRHENLAMIAGYTDKLCIWDLETNKITELNIERPQEYPLIPSFPLKEQSGFSGHDMIAGVSYLNATQQGYFISVEPYENIATRFQVQDGKVKEGDVFNYIPSDQTRDSSPSKCVDISSINAFACFRKNALTVFINKIDERANQNYPLSLLTNERKQKPTNASTSSLYSNNIENQVVENVFAYDPRGQLCQVFDLTVQCFSINVRCRPNANFTSVAECDTACKGENKGLFWDPISMSCISYKNITCGRSQSYEPYAGGCTLDCSKVQSANPGSEYSTPKKCVCEPYLQWFQQLQQCRVNCSAIAYTDPQANYSLLEPTQCRCLRSFQYLPKLGGADVRGQCRFICPNGSFADLRESENICQCPLGLTWNSTSLKCEKSLGGSVPGPVQAGKNGGGLPGWAIAVIIVSVLLLVAVASFWGYRRWKKGKQAGQNEVPASSERAARDEVRSTENFIDKNKSGKESSIQACSVCNSQETSTNCEGPCGHFFHFSCIKGRIDSGEVECPECFKVFQRGVADLKFVDRDEQIYTISDC